MKKTPLIFLISQPRTGSTLIQRILGSHPDIHTTSEPWVMLHPLYSMKKTGIETEYSSDLALKGLLDFLNQIDDGPLQYREKLREMYGSLYERLLEPTGKEYYLDKTPRYYFIINELYELFPGAKFIILLRNPIAVLSSIVESWTKGDWYRLSEYKHDLLYAPDSLLEGIEKLGGAVFRLQYENVLANPESEIKKACDYIGVGFYKKMIEYGSSEIPRWQFGDQGTVHEKSRPDDFNSKKWIRSLENPQAWRVMREYLDYLGEDRINRMGYSFSELESVLIKNRPEVDIDQNSISLFTLLDNTHDALLERKQLQEELQQKNQIIQNKDQRITNIESQLQQKVKLLHDKEQLIKNKDNQIQQKDKLLHSKEQAIKDKDDQIRIIDQQLQKIRNSSFSRLGRIIILPLSILKIIFLKIKK